MKFLVLKNRFCDIVIDNRNIKSKQLISKKQLNKKHEIKNQEVYCFCKKLKDNMFDKIVHSFSKITSPY